MDAYHIEKCAFCKRLRSRRRQLARALLLLPSMHRERFEIDSAQSAIVFSARNSTPAPVRGRFSRWSASIEADSGELERGRVEVMVDTTSVETGDAAVDKLLSSAPFLGVAHHPEAAFKSTHVKVRRGKGLRITGELNVRGVKLEVLLDATVVGTRRDPWGNRRVRFAAKTWLDAADLGIEVTGDATARARVDIHIDLEAVQQPAPKSERAALNSQ
jgi:polyisoprenoid-binding protein YceI